MNELERRPPRSAEERRLVARERARERTRRQRRLGVLVVGGIVVLVGVGWFTLGHGSNSPKAADAGEPPSSTAQKPPPELPRGGRQVLPHYRLVALYGAPQDPQLGELGIGTPAQAAQKLLVQSQPYAEPGRPVMPAMELIATLVTAAPGDDGKYRMRQTSETIDRYLAAARKAKALLILDIQPGRASFMSEVKAYRHWLEQPDVGLAIDPEWSMGPGEVPGQVIGHTTSAIVNQVTSYVSKIVEDDNLPQKVLIVHQFTPGMIEHKKWLKRPPGVALTVNVDGFGTRDNKVSKYDLFATNGSHWFNGFKLFYHEDVGLMRPKSVLNLLPPPDVVVYE
jgi:hypothetical protein